MVDRAKNQAVIGRVRSRTRNLPACLAWWRAAALACGSVVLGMLLLGGAARAAALDELPLEQWAKLREAERYQLNIAEKYFKEQQWKVALSEYEKFLTLYETSIGAPYAQLKWSICQLHLRRVNTAIKDGFQSVIDYWPESAEATAAAFYIGNSYRANGEVKKAKLAYAKCIESHPDHLVATLSRVNLVEMAEQEGDTVAWLKLMQELVFQTQRNKDNAGYCVDATRKLASHYMHKAAFTEAKQALETTWPSGPPLLRHLVQYGSQAASSLTANDQTRLQGHKVADQVIGYIRQQLPQDITTDEAKGLLREYYYHIADLHSSARRPAEVPKVYDELGKKLGVDDDLRGRLAGWYKSQGRHDEARSIYLQFDNPINGYTNVAQSFMEEKKYDQAIEVYQRLANSIDPDRRIHWISHVASAHISANRCDEAVSVYQDLVKEDVANVPTWLRRIADTYYHFSRWKEAIAAYRQVNDKATYWNMARAHRHLKQPKEAILLYNQLMDTDGPSALLEIARTLEESGQIEPAKTTYMQVCKRFPKTGQASTAHVHLQSKYKLNVTLGGAKDE